MVPEKCVASLQTAYSRVEVYTFRIVAQRPDFSKHVRRTNRFVNRIGIRAKSWLFSPAKYTIL